MGWDSESEGEIDIDAQLAAKAAAKKNQFEEEEAKALKAAASKAAAPAAKAKAPAPSVSSDATVEVVTRTYDEDEIASSDPRKEKERMKRLQDKAEMALMDDLFAGCDKPESAEGSSMVREIVKTIKEDSFEKLTLLTSKDVEILAGRCSDKILSSAVKSAGHKFVNEIIRSVGHTLTVTDLNQLQKVLKDLSTAKAREQAEKLAGKKKLSTDVAQMKKGAKVDVFDAIGEVYGDDYEEYDEEDY
jgi:hypothetical protein